MAISKSIAGRRVDGKVSTPSEGPRAKAVGAKPCGKASYKSRGTQNPVK